MKNSNKTNFPVEEFDKWCDENRIGEQISFAIMYYLKEKLPPGKWMVKDEWSKVWEKVLLVGWRSFWEKLTGETLEAVPFTQDAVKEYLDRCIIFWNSQCETKDECAAKVAEQRVDAYQGIRWALFREELRPLPSHQAISI